MKWFFRSSVLVVVLTAFVIGAVAVWFRFRPEGSGPTPLPLAPGDREIVWLSQATSTATWERFVTAVSQMGDRMRDELPGLKVYIDDRAFPQQTTAVPEVSMTWDGAGGSLVFRWYKLTSDWKPQDWIKALIKNRPPPLAIIGGSTSDGARDLAIQLREATETLEPAQRPLLLFTTATADMVDWPADVARPVGLVVQDPVAIGRAPGVRLNAIYPERTFRFCFSNRQMSNAVANFIWSRDDLRPPSDNRVHAVQWDDDAYSRDLVEGFNDSLNRLIPGDERVHFGAPLGIFSSFGSFYAANRFEVLEVGELLDKLDLDLNCLEARRVVIEAAGTWLEMAGQGPQIHLERTTRFPRPLLVVAGQTVPMRRFLRELARTAPGAARRFVVATGDSLAFNTIYRDRVVLWPIQDLPYQLVLFSHANPVDVDAGFKPHALGEVGTNHVGDSAATGTEDVLLFAEIVGALARGIAGPDGGLGLAPRLAEQLRAARYINGQIVFGADSGRLLFAPDGNRATGTGEHVVNLKPERVGNRVLAEATIEVWAWREAAEGRTWEACCKPIVAAYSNEARLLGRSDP